MGCYCFPIFHRFDVYLLTSALSSCGPSRRFGEESGFDSVELLIVTASRSSILAGGLVVSDNWIGLSAAISALRAELTALWSQVRKNQYISTWAR